MIASQRLRALRDDQRREREIGRGGGAESRRRMSCGSSGSAAIR